ncbi:MAG: ADP-ribosyl-[dinitrogen reductase] hydrolase [Gammaproteobacteria bacterium]|nr:ADP-ribosyl-[dinitrogen reductase] hydrolase [Gammaproteobacteria bacterium]
MLQTAALEKITSLVPASLLEKINGAYLGLAVGDALGATVEFMTPREIQHAYGTHDTMRGGGWLKLKRGQVTDDTTMALALGEAIIQNGSVDTVAIAKAFDHWMKQKPVDIGNTVRRGIVHFRYSGIPVVPASDQDAGNGACMRCLPIALFTYGQSLQRMKAESKRQAHVTHNNELSDASCECVIEMIQGAFAGQDKADMLKGPVASLIKRFPQFAFRIRRKENPSGFIVDTLHAVLQAFFDTDDFTGCLIDVVNRGGDADTTGAIAGMIAGSYYGVSRIPPTWRQALDKTIYQQCEEQATALMELALQNIEAA